MKFINNNFINNNIFNLPDYNGNKFTSKELEKQDIPQFNKKIKETNLFIYIEPNFYYTDGRIREYQALKRLSSFKTPAKSSSYSGTTKDESGNFSLTIEANSSEDYNYKDYDYNDTFLITGGLPDKTNFNNGIILKLNKVDRPKAGSKKYLIFDFVGYYNEKETQKLSKYPLDKDNHVTYANNNTFNNMYLTSAEIQKLTIAYNFSLTMLELNRLNKMFTIEHKALFSDLEKFTDLKEPASSLHDALINSYQKDISNSRTNVYNSEKRYLNQYHTYGGAIGTNCLNKNNNYTDYSNCLEEQAGKTSYYIIKPVSCLPFAIVLVGIGYPLCLTLGSGGDISIGLFVSNGLFSALLLYLALVVW